MAAPGDILQLSGEHPGFTLDKGLTLIGPAVIRDQLDGTVDDYDSTFVIPAGQHARAINLNFFASAAGLAFLGHRLEVTGNASFEDCQFSSTFDGGTIVHDGTVVIQRGYSWNPGGLRTMSVEGGICTLVDTTFEASTLSSSSIHVGPPAIEQRGGILTISNCSITGSRGGFSGAAFVPPGSALDVQGGTTFVTDSELSSGDPFFLPSAPAVVGNGNVRIARTTLNGEPSTGLVDEPALVSITGSGPLEPGQSFTATATAGDAPLFVAMLAGFTFGANTIPLFPEPLFGNAAGLVVVDLQTPAPLGQLATTIAIPATSTLTGQALWCQALQADASGFRLSPPVGGMIR